MNPTDNRLEELPEVLADPANRHEPFPLTDTQLAYVAGRTDLFELGNVSTHAYYEFEGALDIPRFVTAWQRLVERHDMLRAVIDVDAGEQRVLAEVPPVPIELIDLRDAGPDQATARHAELRGRLSHEVRPAGTWPLFAVVVCRLTDTDVRVHVSFDALILDFLSWKLLSGELSALYADPDAALPELDLTFRDYVLAAAKVEHSEPYREARDYWAQRLPRLPPAPRLPTAREPSTVHAPKFVGRAGTLDAQRWNRLKVKAGAAGLTPTGLTLAVFAEVLTEYSRSAHFTLNVPWMNRLPLHPDADRILGEFATFGLLEVDNRVERPFRERAAAIQRRVWQDLAHHHFSGVRALRELVRSRGGMDRALMPVVLTSTIGLRVDGIQLLGGELPQTHQISQTPQVYLDVQIDEHNGELTYNWDAVEEIFPAGLVPDMFAAFTRLLERLENDENSWHEPHPLPTAARPGTSGRQREIPDTLVQSAFVAQVAQRPDQPAVITPETTLTYRELHNRATQLGHWLRANGARPDTPVAVVLDKGADQFVAAYGALFAGSPYLPVDAGQPAARVSTLVSNADIVLTSSTVDISWPVGSTVLCLDTDFPVTAGVEPLPVTQTPNDLAYLLFTSGSTGEPKGAMIEHQGMVNCLAATVAEFGIGPADRCLAVTALHHDMSTFDVFGVLGAGGTAVVPSAAGAKDAEHWADLVERHGVTVWNSVPAMMEMLLDQARRRPRVLESLRLALLGGDWIPLAVPAALTALGVEVVSVGGPTETTLWNIWHRIDRVDPTWRSVPYGRPIANTTYYVLDERLRDRPDWVPGEMYCAGPGVARGYWRDDERTAQRFPRHPVTGERLYRTGDLGRFRPDGTIEFVGRADQQLKIAGQRVEPGEVESALAAHPDVAAAVVVGVARDDRPGSQALAGYLTAAPGAELDLDAVREFARTLLPAHMVPARLRVLETFPLTANGKVDRNALPAPEPTAVSDSVRPGTALERVVALVWERVLGAAEIGAHDNFFAVGGDSVLAGRIVSELREALDTDQVSLRALFGGLTVAAMAAELAGTDPQWWERVAELYLEIEQMSDEDVTAELAG